jgi:hypothetical protein
MTREFNEHCEPVGEGMPQPTPTFMIRKDYGGESTIRDFYSVKPSQEDLFTDPRILQECREILNGKSSATSAAASLASIIPPSSYSSVSYNPTNFSSWSQNLYSFQTA